MIKRFLFGTSRGADTCPPVNRPLRTAVSKPTEPFAQDKGFITQWFADVHSLGRYETWERSQQTLCPVVLTQEVIQRGGAWLERRWTDGGRKWKHVALARRAPGMSTAEFSMRWCNHAGRVMTRNAGSVVIPEVARGLAYVQNHPLTRHSGEWPYDAITEVWFDDADSMQSRIAWFNGNNLSDDLFGEAILAAFTEDVLVA